MQVKQIANNSVLNTNSESLCILFSEIKCAESIAMRKQSIANYTDCKYCEFRLNLATVLAGGKITRYRSLKVRDLIIPIIYSQLQMVREKGFLYKKKVQKVRRRMCHICEISSGL